ncbi:MAG: zinc-ribbon and DUF3426 domain-containing protein [Methylococcaceae bacterium]|jgi:predicted Zn finger-like uncharacterized protein
MFANCPECHESQPISIEQLRENRGMVRCIACQIFYDAIPGLTETSQQAPSQPTVSELPWENKRHTAGSRFWQAGIVLNLILLFGQFVYFEADKIPQQPKLRLWLEKISGALNFPLPAYKNLDELNVLEGSFSRQADNNYLFHAVLSNQSEYRMAYPRVKLSLLDFNGDLFAQRIFQAKDYLSPTDDAYTMAANATLEISLIITPPATKIGGYTFELIN